MAGESDNDDIRSLLQGAMDGKITAEGPLGAAESLDVGASDAGGPALDGQSDGSAVRNEQAASSQGGERPRDDQGRFTKTPEGEKPRETLTLKPGAQPPAAQAQPPQQAQQQKPAEQQETPPPLEWKGAAKVDWNRLPAPVRSAIRETYDTLQQASAEVAPIKELIDTNRQFLVNEAGTVGEAFRQLIQFAQAANTVDGTVQLVHHLLQRRGIDPRSVFGGQPVQQNGNQPQPPDLDRLIDQRVQQRLQPFQAQIEQRENQQFIDTIESFRADPAHPYFNDVSQHMGWLMKAGYAKTMQEAYDQATKAHPVIGPQLQASVAQEAANARAAEVAAAQAAQRTSLTGSPTMGATSVNGESDGSIRGDLLAAMRQHQGAV